MKKVLMAGVVGGLMAGGAYAVQFDIADLPGYGVATSPLWNFNGSGGWAGWSVPGGTVVLGANIISAGDSISDFSVFRPAGPNEAFPHYTYGENEYGFVIADNGLDQNDGVQIEVYYADMPTGYTISKSMDFGYSATGWGGWSAPSGHVVSGGGYQFLTDLTATGNGMAATLGAYPEISQFAEGPAGYPHYTYSAGEEGWVVQSGAVGGPANVYVISFDAPVATPDGGLTALLMGLSSLALAGVRRLVV